MEPLKASSVCCALVGWWECPVWNNLLQFAQEKHLQVSTSLSHLWVWLHSTRREKKPTVTYDELAYQNKVINIWDQAGARWSFQIQNQISILVKLILKYLSTYLITIQFTQISTFPWHIVYYAITMYSALRRKKIKDYRFPPIYIIITALAVNIFIPGRYK